MLSGKQIQVATNFKIVLLLYHAPCTISALRSHKWVSTTDRCPVLLAPLMSCQELALGPTNTTNAEGELDEHAALRT